MVKAKLIILCLILLSVLISDCSWVTNDNCEGGDILMSSQSTELLLLEGAVDTQLVEFGFFPMDSDTINSQMLLMMLEFNQAKITHKGQIGGLWPSAFACPPTIVRSIENIHHINIVANRDYDTLHPQGYSLNDVFGSISVGLNGERNLFSISTLNQGTTPLGERLIFFPKIRPDSSGWYSFRIEFTQVDINFNQKKDALQTKLVFLTR